MTLKYELMAGADVNFAAELKARAQAIQASKADIEDEL
jgi:hypothetical protein